MGSPSMDEYAGAQQAHLDLLRGDTFAVLNHRAKVLDWNQYPASWQAGYQSHLTKSLREGTLAVDRETVERALAEATTQSALT